MNKAVILHRGKLNTNYYSIWTIQTSKYGVVEYITTAEKAYAFTSIDTHRTDSFDKRQHFTLDRYLPMDETNPGKTIDTFFKLTMLM